MAIAGLSKRGEIWRLNFNLKQSLYYEKIPDILLAVLSFLRL
jgi:hypothetical protein